MPDSPDGDDLRALREQFSSTQALADHLGLPRTTVRDRLAALSGGVQTLAGDSGDAAGMRILAIDIETRPALVYAWGLWDQNINLAAVVEDPGVLCWVAKWVGRPEVEFRSSYHDGHAEMVRRAWALLDQADAVTHYNGRRFDVPMLNREFLRLDLTPPAPYKQIDLLTTAKREFKFLSNKLAYVSKQLGLEGKVDHEGFSLWIKCMEGDAAAWAKMREYNVRDVVLLEEAYEQLRPWIRSHPSVGAHQGRDVCPGCGSDKLQARGFAVTSVSKFQRFQCMGCGRWSRSTKRVESTGVTSVPNT